MAKQNKGRKFFATTATAALVASAIVPVASAAEVNDLNLVPSWAKDAVQYLVDNGSVQGDANGNFNPTKNLTRAQAAEILSKELGLEATGTEDFSDVASNNWFYNAVLATTPEIFNGNEKGEFLPNKNLTRQEAAKALVEAFGLTGSASLAGFPDASTVPAWSKSYLETAVANGVINGKGSNLAPTDNITNAEFATMVKRAIDAAIPSVTSVSATNTTTLTVTGNKLGTVKAEDITVEGNTVTSFVASADGKSATVTLGAALVPDLEYKVSAKVNGETKEFKVTYSLEVTTVTVDAKSYDDDTENQLVSFKLNGKEGNLEDLLVNGYTVQFKASQNGVDVTSTLFANASKGLLNTGLTPGQEYKVQVTILKDSDVIVSEQADVKIENFELVASEIKSYELTNSTANGIVMNSDTLVINDTVELTELVAIQNGANKTLDAADIASALADGTLKIQSSNNAVVSVDDAEFTANVLGTATVTVTYGKVTQKINFKVVDGARKLTKVVPAKTSLTTILSPVTNNTLTFEALDQYGDPVVTSAAGDITVESSKVSVAAVADNDATDTYGEGTLTVTPAAKGTTSVVFKDANGKTIGSVAVTVTDNATASRNVIEVAYGAAAGESNDATIDIYDETFVKFKLQPYTAENVKLPASALGGYKVKFDKNVVTVDGDNTGEVTLAAGTNFTVALAATPKVGYSDIALYTDEDVLVGKVRVTVVNNTPKLQAAAIKSIPEVTYAGKIIDYTTLFNITSVSAGDDIVNGITLNKKADSVIRINETDGSLYLDRDGDAAYTDETTDTKLGDITMSVVSGSTGLAGFTDIIAGSTTAAGDKGTIVITVKDVESKVISQSSISVKVPN